MDSYRRSLRMGAAVILCALVLRFGNLGLPQKLTNLLQNPNILSFLIYLETGRNVRFSPSLEEESNFAGESPPPMLLTAPELPAFSAEDGAAVAVYNLSGLDPDMASLITQPLQWQLRSGEPTVLIIHTHATESYTKQGENYTETSAFRTLDEGYNMISIGDRVAEILSSNGIAVLHDRDLHDYPSYNGSYADAREAIEEYLQRYPTIQLVLDLHRDASGDLDNQFRPVVQVDGVPTAQLMLVMGTDASGQSHPHWQENLALGLKLHMTLEAQAAGIMRPLCLRSQRFNQDMTTGSLLIEVGAAGNSHAEALRAAEQLAYAIVTLAAGSE